MNTKKLIDFINLFGDKKKEIIILIILSVIAMLFEALSIAMVFPFLEIVFEGKSSIPNYDFLNFMKSIPEDNYIFMLGIIMITIFTIKASFLTYFSKKRVTFTFNVRTEQSNKLFKSYLYSPLFFHLENNSAQLIRNLNDSNLLSAMARSSVDLLAESLVILGITVLLLYFNPGVTALTILIFGTTALIYFIFIKKKAADWGHKSKVSRGLKLINLKEGFGAIREIKILGKEKFILENFSKNNYLENFYDRIHTFIGSIPKIWFEWLTVLLILFLIYFFSKNSLDKTQIIPILGVYAAAAYRLIPSLVKLVNHAQEIKYCSSAIEPFLQNTKKLQEIEHKEKNYLPKKINFESKIILDNINFKFNNEKFVLKNINLTISKGNFIGIFGKSGSGKTTLINIILGLFKPISGKILVDNFDVAKDLKNWQKLISYIPQNVYIVDDTILKNVAFGESFENINLEKVNNCLKKSNIYNFIYGLKNNVNTAFGELGEQLSGGQRQRLAIARALYRNSEILIFDEITNFLDKENENQIIHEIKNMKNKTRILITHNEEVLKNCDYVYELKNNEIVKKN